MNLEHKLSNLPKNPGVYLMKNEAGEIIYVGKAINLRNRVRSYFQKSRGHSPKVKVMVSHVADIEYIITDSEVEALILENNLIKKHAPWYNVRLKDDKTYPYIKVTTYEEFPRVLLVRRKLQDGARYFGPYTDVSAVRETLSFLRSVFPVRTCRRTITEGDQGRPCLNYHIGRCLGPCAGLVSKEKYGEMISEVILFLEGRLDRLIPDLTRRMEEASSKLEFERAARIRDQIHAVQTMMEKQKIVAEHEDDQDFLGYARAGDLGCVQIFFVRGGKLIGRDHFLLECSPEEDAQEILSAFVKQFYEQAAFIPREIYTPLDLEEPSVLEDWLTGLRGSRVYLHTPQRGPKKQLVDLVMTNAEVVLNEIRSRQERQEQEYAEAISQLQDVLELDRPVVRIEAFDISNIQGNQVVASMVVMEQGMLVSDEYRRFKIRSVEGAPNDYLAMAEVIERRFSRGLKEQQAGDTSGKFSIFPDLVLVDGGKGQLNTAVQIRDKLGIDIPFIGLAERMEEIYVEEQSEPIVLPRDAKGLLLLRKIRDEAHRFALAYHRNLRGKAVRGSVLDEIPGVGPKRKKALIRHFGSVRAIREAGIEELMEVQGISRKIAEEIYQYMHEADRKQ